MYSAKLTSGPALPASASSNAGCKPGTCLTQARPACGGLKHTWACLHPFSQPMMLQMEARRELTIPGNCRQLAPGCHHHSHLQARLSWCIEGMISEFQPPNAYAAHPEVQNCRRERQPQEVPHSPPIAIIAAFVIVSRLWSVFHSVCSILRAPSSSTVWRRGPSAQHNLASLLQSTLAIPK